MCNRGPGSTGACEPPQTLALTLSTMVSYEGEGRGTWLPTCALSVGFSGCVAPKPGWDTGIIRVLVSCAGAGLTTQLPHLR